MPFLQSAEKEGIYSMMDFELENAVAILGRTPELPKDLVARLA